LTYSDLIRVDYPDHVYLDWLACLRYQLGLLLISQMENLLLIHC